MAPGFLLIIILCVILGLVLLTGLIYLAVAITKNRDDDTPVWEVVLLSLLLTPIIAIMLEMLKPYKPDYKRPQGPRLNINDLTDKQKAAMQKELDGQAFKR